VDRDAVNLLTQLGVRNFREVMTAPIGESLDKPGLEPWRRRSRVVLQDLMGQEKVLYLKRFLLPPLRAQIERIGMGAWGHGTAWIEWNNIRRLEAIGVGTMRPIAFAEKVVAGWEAGSLLCTEQVAGESLEKWLPREWVAATERFGLGWRQRVVRELAGVVGRLHRGDLCHRDLYTCHIFIEVEAEGRVSFRLIDLQRMFRMRLRKRRWRVKDLAALAASAPRGLISRTDRMRFLTAYLGPEVPRREVKQWWRDVEGKGARMMQHHEARMAKLREKAGAARPT
jgi:heptose I phosphotransferase